MKTIRNRRDNLRKKKRVGMVYANFVRINRKKLLRRDGKVCKNCFKKEFGPGELTIDHIMPLSHGGSNDLSNLQLLCLQCNRDKSDKIPSLIGPGFQPFKEIFEKIDLFES